MHGRDGRGRQNLECEVAIGNAIERIGHRPVEAQHLCRLGAIDRERRSGKRRRAQRTFVEPLPRIDEPAAVAAEHFDVGQQMMTECDRLRRLQVRETWHDSRSVSLGFLRQNQLQLR
jgi:hypothetical protein